MLAHDRNVCFGGNALSQMTKLAAPSTTTSVVRSPLLLLDRNSLTTPVALTSLPTSKPGAWLKSTLREKTSRPSDVFRSLSVSCLMVCTAQKAKRQIACAAAACCMHRQDSCGISEASDPNQVNLFRCMRPHACALLAHHTVHRTQRELVCSQLLESIQPAQHRSHRAQSCGRVPDGRERWRQALQCSAPGRTGSSHYHLLICVLRHLGQSQCHLQAPSAAWDPVRHVASAHPKHMSAGPRHHSSLRSRRAEAVQISYVLTTENRHRTAGNGTVYARALSTGLHSLNEEREATPSSSIEATQHPAATINARSRSFI